jgi:hypothetical protein
MGSAHYVKNILAQLDELKIEYVPKEKKSANLSFWANLKIKVTVQQQL